MSALRVGVVMPTYNQVAFLPEAIHSLEAQTFPEDRFEVLVVDDCSTDGTNALLSASPLSEFWSMHLLKNLGCGGAINDGVDAFSGFTGWEPDAFTWVSSDNVMYATWLATLSAALKPGVGAVFSAFDMPGQKPGKTVTVRQGAYDPARLISSENCYFGPSFLIRADVWREAGPHEGRSSHDYGHWARVEEVCWRRGLSIVYVDEPLCWYRVHDQQTAKARPDLYDAGEQRAKAMARRATAKPGLVSCDPPGMVRGPDGDQK